MSVSIRKLHSESDSTEEWLESLNYQQKQRYTFLEAKLFWEGSINRGDVSERFGISKNHLTRDLTEYRGHFPQNMTYDISARTYRLSDQFKPAFATCQTSEYLGLLKTYARTGTASVATELGFWVESDALPEPNSRIDRQVLRTVLAAIQQKSACQVIYQSFSQSEKTKRVIWPHALGWNGNRWHVRAFDNLRERYIDFVLARITKATSSEEPLPELAVADTDWQEIETFDVIPNPELSNSQKNVIAREYGMIKRGGNYTWRVKIRRCLIQYFLQRYQLDEGQDINHTRLIVKNKEIVEKYRFNDA